MVDHDTYQIVVKNQSEGVREEEDHLIFRIFTGRRGDITIGPADLLEFAYSVDGSVNSDA